MRDDSAQILFQSSLLEALVSNFGMDRLCPLFDVVYPAFSLPTTASLPLQGALKDGFGEAELNYEDCAPSTLILPLPSKTNSRHFSSLSISAKYHCP